MIQLTDYYLNHDSERVAIARNGYQRASELFSFKKQINVMLGKITF